MKLEEAYYILNNFPRLMTHDERMAKRHRMGIIKLGLPENYDSMESYNRKKEFLLRGKMITEDNRIIQLTQKGYEQFILETAERIKREHPNEYCINRCSKCDFMARTPYARQCRNCGFSWHDEIKAEFKVRDSFKMSGRPFFVIMGELVEGHIEIGFKVDLTFFQLNIITEITAIEFALVLRNGVRKEYPSLCIDVSSNEEELIKKYLKPSAKNLLIIDRK